MSKIALITDTHLGARNGNEFIRDHQFDFYENQFFPYLKVNGIGRVIHLGDFFDSRTALSHKVLSDTNRFLGLLNSYGIFYHQLVGNHDVPNKNNNNYDATTSLLGGHEKVRIHAEFDDKLFGDILICPWVNKENQEEFTEILGSTKAKYVFGHFDVLGARFSKYGNPSQHGLDPNIFKKFDRVISGHFHTKSTIGNIEYLGSPFEYTWVDHNDPKGFHIFDRETGELEFIQNKKNLFYKITVGEEQSCVPPKPKEGFAGKFVSVTAINADQKILKKLPEVLGEVADLQITVRQEDDIILEDIKVGSIDTMLEDGVKSVHETHKDGVLSILKSALEMTK
jgi:DNA repair exonuclease SbcCD nuclease subunit